MNFGGGTLYAKGFEDGTGKESLYGLKQSPKCWYKCLVDFLEKNNFKENGADP